MKDFFISYTRADQAWAEWIAWQLENKGYQTVIQAWDFHAGSNFVADMQQTTVETACTLAVISPAFFNSPYTEAEWTSAFCKDPTGAERKLIMVRVEEVTPPGLLKPRVYIDLAGLKGKEASARLLKQIKGQRAKPDRAPLFPGTAPKRFHGAPPPIWNLPAPRNPNFTGREAYLSALETQLQSGRPAALTQAIKGLGGVGKTQIALEYAYRHAARYQAVWWIRSEDEKTLAADYTLLANGADLPEKDAAEEQTVITAVRNWLEQHPDWLLVFDNAERPEAVRDYIPRCSGGHVLITSRHQAWEKLCPSLGIDLWPREESVVFLSRRTKNSCEAEGNRLAETLGDLPLALEQAAAFINETGIGYDDYLNFHQTRRRELWEEESPPLGYPATVGATWSLSMEKVAERAPAGALVLNLCAYLAPDEIPRALISEAAKYLPWEIAVQFGDALALAKGIKALNHYSLINARPDSLAVHRLVQLVVRDRMTKEEQEVWAAAAVQIIGRNFPDDSYRTPDVWPQCAALLSHGQVAAGHAAAMGTVLESAAGLLNCMAEYLFGRAAYDEAEALYRRALDIRQTRLGPEHLHVAQSLNNLALLLKNQGKFAEAEPLYRRALDIRRTQLGPEKPEVAQSLNNLGMLLKDQGRFSEAEPLLRRALDICETQLGPDHPATNKIRNNLGGLLTSSAQVGVERRETQQITGDGSCPFVDASIGKPKFKPNQRLINLIQQIANVGFRPSTQPARLHG